MAQQDVLFPVLWLVQHRNVSDIFDPPLDEFHFRRFGKGVIEIHYRKDGINSFEFQPSKMKLVLVQI